MEAKSEDMIRLPASRLVVKANELIKENWDDTVIARHAFADIDDVSIRRTKSYSMMLLVLCLVAGAIVCKLMVASVLWSWILTLTLGLVSFILSFSIHRAYLDVKTSSGTVSYDLTDSADLVDGFEVSLSALLKKYQNKA